MKKLTDEKIMIIENWLENKKKQHLTKEEQAIVHTIEGFKKNDWRGIRIEPSKKITSVEEAKSQLERLKRKKV